MYPDWPEPGVPLLPLPRCVGPKLKPFDFQGPQEIEFLEFLGEGLHSYVVKVNIHGQIYALKLFRFSWDECWMPDAPGFDPEDLKMMTMYSNFSEPFNAECRAFGRLEEAGHTELAVRCFGYILLDEKHERALTSQLRAHNAEKIEFEGNPDYGVGDGDMYGIRSRFKHTTKSGKNPPIRCILKEFGQRDEDLRTGNARKILQDVMKLQQLGMINIDVAHRQIINGKFADFSKVITTPHYVTNVELRLKCTPELASLQELEIFERSIGDYWDFDDMILEWNDEHENPKDHVSVYAFSRMWGSRPRYNLRSTPERDCIYTYVDPRKYNWKYHAAKELSMDPAKGGEKPRHRLDAKPPKWCFETSSDLAEELRMSTQWCTRLAWGFANGRFFPVKRR